MAESSPSSPRTANPALRTAILLVVFFALAFFLRSYFSMDTGFDAVGQRQFETGNDPYYHERTVQNVLDQGTTVGQDNVINYPEGRVNPNPPFWTWTTAPVASVLQTMGVTDPVGTALNIMVAFWGALTVVPVYMVGRDLWNRRAGLWGAFFIAISAPHIQRSIWGYGDHDAISMFSIVLGFAFLIRALTVVQSRNFVASWRDGKAVGAGLKAGFAANRQSLAWALLAGISISSAALAWKGYPYALAIIAIATALHLFIDHLRNRDTLGVFLVYLLATAVIVVLPWLLYYVNYPGFVQQTVGPSMYVLVGILAAGLILVPTRDLPSVLVFPALAVAAVLGLVLLLLVFPVAGDKVFSGLGYFSQSKLYSTIAEAQRPTLGTVAANFGFFTFLLAFWGFLHLLVRSVRGDGPKVLGFAWALVAMFMMFAASRFIMNAAPLFAVLIGYAMMRIVGFLGGTELRKRYRSSHGQNVVRRATGAVGWKQVVGAIGLALLLVLPVLSAVDASMSSDFESQHKLINTTRGAPCQADPQDASRQVCTGNYVHPPRVGAFGISFELRDNGWNEAMQYLATLDQDKPIEQRPAFVAWWDYGHWATAIGKHPTVADPFQSHYELAGRFLASDSEEEATAWLTIHLLNGDRHIHEGSYSEPVRALLQQSAPALLDLPLGNENYDRAYDLFGATVKGDAVYKLFEDVQAAAGKEIRYVGVDDRMYPYDDPRYDGVEQAGIFYAPVYLANKNPDLYVQEKYGTSQQLTRYRYAVDGNNNSYERKEPLIQDASGQNYTVYQGYAYPEGKTPLQGASTSSGVPLFQSQSLAVQDRFYGTMFARAFGGLAAEQQPAGEGLTHWRVIHQSVRGTGASAYRQVAILEYVHGVQVSGTVVDESGAPLARQTVGFVDGNGAVHGTNVTSQDGKFTVHAPFAVDGDLRFALLVGGQPVFTDNRSDFQFSREDARAGRVVADVQVKVTRGSVAGTVYVDANGDGVRQANETVVPNARVSVGSVAANSTATGNYTLPGIAPGQVTVSATHEGYSPASRSVTVRAAQATVQDIALVPVNVNVTARFLDTDGKPLPSIRIEAKPLGNAGPTTMVTDANGTVTKPLVPGNYVFLVNQTTTGETPQTYVGSATYTVPVGSKGEVVDIKRSA